MTEQVVFDHQPSVQTWTVPQGVNTVTLKVSGAAGGHGQGFSGLHANAPGGYAAGELAVSAGDTLYIRVGERGQDGSVTDPTGGWPNGGDGGVSDQNGGAGGGSSDVRYQADTLAEQVIVAGGGGGQGDAAREDGGAGGGLNGGTSAGGTQTSGGTYPNGTNDGGRFTGGDGETGFTDEPAGGGGGGGYYGGAGGTGEDGATTAKGGGGGSGYIGGVTNATTTQGGSQSPDRDGQVVIEYEEPPAAPDAVTITYPSPGTLDISWTPDTSGGPTDQFRVQTRSDGGAWATVATVDSSVTAYTWTGALVADDTFQARVRAERTGVGNSAYTSSSTIETNVEGLTVTGTAAREVSLSWTGVTNPDDYIVYRATEPGVDATDTVAGTTASPSFVDSGLVDGREYHYRVAARFDGEPDARSTERAATTPLPAPTAVSLTAASRAVTATWTEQDNNPDGSVRLRLKHGSTDFATPVAEITVPPDSQASHTFTGLRDGERYTVDIDRTTPDAYANGDRDTATTPLPAPTALTTTSVDAASAALSWSATHNYGDTLVQLRRAGTTDWTTVATVSRTTESYTVTDLLNGEQYRARVRAQTEHRTTTDQ